MLIKYTPPLHEEYKTSFVLISKNKQKQNKTKQKQTNNKQKHLIYQDNLPNRYANKLLLDSGEIF